MESGICWCCGAHGPQWCDSCHALAVNEEASISLPPKREFSSEEMEFLRYSAPRGVQVPVDPDESGGIVKQEDQQYDPDDPQHRLR